MPTTSLILGESWHGLLRYPLRTFLALGGLVIGVASVVGSLAMVRAANRLFLESAQSWGYLDVITVSCPPVFWKEGRRFEVKKRTALVNADARRIRRALPELSDVMLHGSFNSKVTRPGASVDAQIEGFGWNARTFFPFEVVAGRFFTHDEDKAVAKVAVITERLARELFGGVDSAMGQEVVINLQRFQVIGVARTSPTFEGDEPATCAVPFRTFQERLGGSPFAEIMLKVDSVKRIPAVKADLQALLPSLRAGVPAESYDVDTREDDLEELGKQSWGIGVLLMGVALLSMVAAGSGILNTLLVGVRERTREIGTRRALGARRSLILWQFLSESALLSIPGGLAGMGGGWLVAHGLGRTFATMLEKPEMMRVSIGRGEAILAAAAAVGVAAIAGLWPALQASRVDPAEALRYE